VSYQSWLKDVTHINDIDPWHTTLRGHHKDWGKMYDERCEKLSGNRREPLHIDPQFSQFFNSRLHDSQLYNFTRTKNSVVVSINEYAAQVLAWDTQDALDLPSLSTPFLIDLVFHDVQYTTSVRPDFNGTLRYDNIATALPNDSEFHMTFIRDWFFQSHSRLQWVARIRADHKPSKKLDSNIYVLIDCATATAIDRRLPALKKIYGPNIVRLWNDYLNRIDFTENIPNYPHFVGGFYDYFERRLPAHGLTWEDLRVLR